MTPTPGWELLGEQLCPTFKHEISKRLGRWRKMTIRHRHHMPCTKYGRIFNIQNDQLPMLDLKAHGVEGNKRNSETGDDSLFDGFVAGHFHGDGWFQSMLFKKSLHDDSGARSLLTGDQFLVIQCGGKDAGVLSQRVFGVGDKCMRMVGKDLGSCFQVFRRAAHDGKVNIAVTKFCNELVTIADIESNLNVGVVLSKEAHHSWN